VCNIDFGPFGMMQSAAEHAFNLNDLLGDVTALAFLGESKLAVGEAEGVVKVIDFKNSICLHRILPSAKSSRHHLLPMMGMSLIATAVDSCGRDYSYRCNPNNTNRIAFACGRLR
jgi:hypothetical protein